MELITTAPLDINTPAMKQTAAYLRSLYTGLTFPAHYGDKELDALCGMSASFGHCHTPDELAARVPEAPGLLSLWVLIGWGIDNVFDKHSALTTDADLAALIRILDLDPTEAGLSAGQVALAAKAGAAPHPLVASLLEATDSLYNGVYVPATAEYAQRTPGAWAMLKTWYSRFVAHVRDRADFKTTAEFLRFRLADVGIMCQFAQVMLFSGREPAPADDRIWHTATLAIAAINDIASFPRDLKQGTPNLVAVRMHEAGVDAWDAMKWADEKAGDLEQETAALGKDTYVGEVAAWSVHHARQWHFLHPRYTSGTRLLISRRRLDRDAFAKLLAAGAQKADNAHADPRTLAMS